MARERAREAIAAAMEELRDLLTSYPHAVTALLHHLDHMSADELLKLENGAIWAQTALRQVVEDTTPDVRPERLGDGYPVDYVPRTPHCRQCAPRVG
jgi:hypothetical protein